MTQRASSALVLRALSAASLLALLCLTLAWELRVAPLRPGGSWLALKAVPLLFPLRGVLAGAPYTYRWAVMLLLLYVAEGLVRLSGESSTVTLLAAAELTLAAVFFITGIAYVRVRRSEDRGM